MDSRAKTGYFFNLVFVWLKNVELALSRVAARIEMGGHSVSEITIRRRYKKGLDNFFRLYSPIADSWQFYDNSNINNFKLIATKTKDAPIVIKPTIWQKILDDHYEK